MQMHFVLYLDDISLSMMFTISAVAPIFTGLQLTIKAFIVLFKAFLGLRYDLFKKFNSLS